MVRKLKPEESIAKLKGITIGDFWSWAFSDILSNGNRGVFAEFLVGTALGVLDKPRTEWDGYDLYYAEKKIEVKASAFVQSWYQTRLSTISFDIAPKNAWSSSTNTFANKIERSADCYVFCLFRETDRDRANVFDIDMWEFYVVLTAQIDARHENQKSLRLSRVQALAQPIKYEHIKSTIDSLLFGNTGEK